MRRLVLALLLAGLQFIAPCALAEPFSRGLLWEISRPGTNKSYLFGTMHAADQRLLWLSPPVEKAFADSRCFIMEMIPDEAAARRFAESIELPAEETLSAQLPEPGFSRLRDILTGRGMEAGRIERIKPWAALLLLTEGQSATSHSLDTDLYVRAHSTGKTIEALESVEEQIAVFDDIPVKTQVALLVETLRTHDDLPKELEQSIAAYQRGDLRRLRQLALRLPGAPVETKRHLAMLEKKIVLDRNIVMAYRLQTSLRRCATFAAVGALHLYGRRGVLQLLRDDGWTIRRRN